MLIPGVGKSIARDLEDLGITRIVQLRGRSPDKLYDELSRLRKVKIDCCVLYVFRCAVYYAGNVDHDPEKLRWWNWKE
jgi:hypothetical protein